VFRLKGRRKDRLKAIVVDERHEQVKRFPGEWSPQFRQQLGLEDLVETFD
jgi:hypothetical protein